MKKILLIVITALLAVSTSLSLEPMKVGFVYTAGTPTSVRVQLADNTNSALFTGESFTTGITPNGSGVIVVNVRDHAGSAGAWAAVNASSVTTYHTIDIYVNGTLYAQYRLDALILAQAQNGILDQDGNLTPPENGSGSLGTDELRWSDLFVEGNTVHIGPALGMGVNELAFSYDDGTNTATMTVAGQNVYDATDDVFTFNKLVNQNIGNNNTAFGFGALQDNTSGYENTAIGVRSLTDNTTGRENTAVGYLSLQNNQSGIANTAIGLEAMRSNVSGIYNTAIGIRAFENATDESNSVGVGNRAGASLLTGGGGNVFLGVNAGSSVSQKTDAQNSIAIGANTFTTADNQVVIGNSLITETNLQGLVKITGGADITGNIKLGNDNDIVMEGQSGILYNTTAPIRVEDDLAVGVSGGTDDKFYVSLATGNTTIDGDVTLTNMAGSGTQNIQVDNTGKIVVGGGTGAFTSASGTTRANNTGDNFYVGQGDYTYVGPGQEYKMFYDRSNGSFRVGNINGDYWDLRGSSSFAAGYNTKANGISSVALGDRTTASNAYSTAMGFFTTASGSASTAMGVSTTASGNRATAMGNSTTASGNTSTAMGSNTTAKSYAETVIGAYNTDYTIATDGDIHWEEADRLFVIGNGTSSVATSDAMIVYKNGEVVVPALGGSGTQNIQVDNTGKLVTAGVNGGGTANGNGLDFLTINNPNITASSVITLTIQSSSFTFHDYFIFDLGPGFFVIVFNSPFSALDKVHYTFVNP